MTQADREIRDLLSAKNPGSFFLYAGAGSGKTSTLIQSLSTARLLVGEKYRSRGSSIAVITYTNAASNEIRERLGYDTFTTVETIHSFAWQMIESFPKDIARWLEVDLTERIEILRGEETRGRAGTKASADRLRRIERAQARLAALPRVRKFAYSPDQTRPARGGLSHAEVLGSFAYFLREKSTFQNIFVGRFPIVLIDEVQDTNKHVIAALLNLQITHHDRFTLGLFGDTMQRIYADGDPNLESSVPAAWARPRKTTNFRSGNRIIELSNRIRSSVDDQLQTAPSGASDGTVRAYIVDERTSDKLDLESNIRNHMREACFDEGWGDARRVKTLILEHAMAAKRYGFGSFLAAFSGDSTLRAAMMSGQTYTSSPAWQIGQQVVPLVTALRTGDTHLADRVLRKYSPLMARGLDRDEFVRARESGVTVRDAARRLTDVILSDDQPTIRTILSLLRESQLLVLHEVLEDVLDLDLHVPDRQDDSDDALGAEQQAWSDALDVRFDEFVRYFEYLSGESPFDTHQGVKGLEFDRVMVILDDEDAGGFGFSYKKLFAAHSTPQFSGTAEDSVSRTRRLFYVACTRARSSLAIVLYSSDIAASRAQLSASGWFSADELVVQADIATSL